MNILARLSAAERTPATLEELLVAMQKFGKPRLGMYGNDGRWSCAVEMHVSAKGATFEIKSEFGLTDPLSAAKQCYERVVQTLRDLGGAA